MSEKTENTLSAYLGPEFQQRLIWQLLVEPEFAEKILPDLAIEYFDDPNLKRLFIIMLEYFHEFEKVPNLQSQSIHQAIHAYKTPNNVIEEESLFAVIKRITMWNERIINKQMHYDGDAVQKSAKFFIKQQEYRKLSEHIQMKVKDGGIKNKFIVAAIEETFQKIALIGEEEDDCESLTEGIEKALRKEFRETIPTGIGTIDELTEGGLGKGEIGVILAPSGVGKAQPLTSKILTPNGWITMGDVNIGSEVVGSDGKPQKVLAVYPQGERDIYKVEFNDGTSTMCDKEHIWLVNSLNQRTANTTKRINGKRKHIKVPDLTYKPLTIEALMTDYVKTHGGKKKLNYRIPIIKPIEFNETTLPIDPYLLGALIGDGSLTQDIPRFTSVDNGIINKINGIIETNYIDLSVKQVSNTQSFSITGKAGRKNELFQKIKELKLNVHSYEKHIPDIYLHNSISNRISLLQGLMDTDGYASKSGRVQYTTTSETLKNNVRELVLSLGGFCKVKEKLPKYKYLNETKTGRLSYTLTISFSDETIKLFQLERKQSRVVYREKYKYNKYISNIEYSHKEEAQCIYVENDDHLYVTNDYILTHNTTALTIIANTAYEQEKNVAQIIFEDTKDQIKRKHFTIWAESALSRLNEDEENERVFNIADAKAREMEGKCRLIIKRFSQEDTTMKDVRNWMLSYQKKWGFKFDLLVLDYLDCLESHKMRQDRTESELTIIKGFEALAADFDIPAWTAIQSNRSGFGSEFVEAHQTGGSIKRVQKAHFFMSVAKTPAQQEANFANIRIIKARFAKDGQAFEDCVFNNDTMQIIIDDPKYVYTKNYKNLKHYDEADVEKLEKKANTINEIHVAISQHDEGAIIEKINTEDINSLLRSNAAPEDNNEGATEGAIEGASNAGLLELDENADIETLDDGVNDAVSDAVSDAVNDDLLDFSGDTTTKLPVITIPEVKLVPTEEVQPQPKQEFVPPAGDDEVMKQILATDPDAPQGKHKSVNDMLVKKRDYQHVIKKE